MSADSVAGRRGPGRRALLLGLYVALLVVSHLVRAFHDPRPVFGPGTSVATVLAVQGDRLLDQPVELAYLDIGAAAGPERLARATGERPPRRARAPG